jgi:hypothetical protein
MGKDSSLPNLFYLCHLTCFLLGGPTPPLQSIAKSKGGIPPLQFYLRPLTCFLLGGQTPPLQSIAKSKGGISALAILFKTIENVAFGSHPAWCKLRLHYTRLYAGDNL